MRILSVGIVRARDDSCNNATLYRYVGPQGQLREQGEKVLAR